MGFTSRAIVPLICIVMKMSLRTTLAQQALALLGDSSLVRFADGSIALDSLLDRCLEDLKLGAFGE